MMLLLEILWFYVPGPAARNRGRARRVLRAGAGVVCVAVELGRQRAGVGEDEEGKAGGG